MCVCVCVCVSVCLPPLFAHLIARVRVGWVDFHTWPSPALVIKQLICEATTKPERKRPSPAQSVDDVPNM